MAGRIRSHINEPGTEQARSQKRHLLLLCQSEKALGTGSEAMFPINAGELRVLGGNEVMAKALDLFQIDRRKVLKIHSENWPEFWLCKSATAGSCDT
jgi:hypothetical protein